MISASRPGPGAATRTARAVVLALIMMLALAGCGSSNSDLCQLGANQLTLAELDQAALTFARAERADPDGCGLEGLQDVAQERAAASIAVARARAAESVKDFPQAQANYARALRLNVDDGDAIAGLRRVMRTSSDVGKVWRPAVALKDSGYTEEARAAVVSVLKAHPEESVPKDLQTLAPDPTDTAAASSDQRGAEALPELSTDLTASSGGPGFFTMAGWSLVVIVGMAFLVVVVLSRGGNEHLIPRAVSGVTILVDRFTPRPTPAGAAPATLAPAPSGAGSSGAGSSGAGSSGAGSSGAGSSGAGSSGQGAPPAGSLLRAGTDVGTSADPPAAAPPGSTFPPTAAEANSLDTSLIDAEISEPTSATFSPAPIPMSQAIDNAVGVVAATPSPPHRWRMGGMLKRTRLAKRDDLGRDPQIAAAESQPKLLPGKSVGGLPSRNELLSRVVMLERRDRARENALARISSRKDAEVTSVLVTSSHAPWQSVRNGDSPRMIVIDTRVYWSGSGRESYTPGSLVVRQTTSTVDDAQRDELLSLAVPAPMDDSTWHIGALTGLLDALTDPPGDGHWTRWLESPGHIRYESVISGQGSLTDQWRAVVLHEKVSVAPSDVALTSLLPLSGNGDVQLRTTHRIRDLVESLGLDAGALLPVGRHLYALQLVLTSDLVTSIAAVERSVAGDALSQAISREVLDVLGSDLGVVGTEVIDVLAGAGRGTARRLALRQMLDGVRKELSDAAEAHS